MNARLPEERATLVVIDDDYGVRSGLSHVLRQTYRLEFFDRAAPALAYLRANGSADVVILDIRMEEIDGVQAYMEIRSIAPQLPVIFYTAYPLEDLGEETKRHLQYVNFLSKGCTVSELRQALKDAMGET